MSYRLLFPAALLLPFGVAACSAAPAKSQPTDDAGLTDAGVDIAVSKLTRDPPSASALAAAVTANNAFALDLYGQVAPTVDGGNLMTSPLSASLALTMAYAGAQGTTASQMASVLQFDADAGSPFDGQNALSQALAGRAAAALASDKAASMGAAPSSSDYQLQVVNSMWGQKTYVWGAPFLDILAKSYGTGVYLEDFITAPSAALQAINGWVSLETADKINNLLLPEDITQDTRLVLVNAVHLKLPWVYAFLPSATTSTAFTRGDGSTVTASMMHATIEAGYADTASAQVVSLPLAGNQLSVLFMLPKTDLAGLVSSLAPATWATLTATQTASVTLALPKFDFTSPSVHLRAALQALGMTAAFDPTQANFQGICTQSIYISDVIQKAMMAVAENGVEAAAATAIVFGTTGAPSAMAKVTFDHPFAVAIVDASGAILFLGQIDDPTAGGSP